MNICVNFLFCTESMCENYKKFGEKMLVDAIYKTNKYQVPLVVLTGITNKGEKRPFWSLFNK